MRKPGEELRDIESEGLLRQLRPLNAPQSIRMKLPNGKVALNFSSNDYLGLANDPGLKEAFRENIDKFGVGSGASRLVCGTLAPHRDLEEQLAHLKNAEAALTFSSGFAAATGAIPALCGKDDFIILDKLCHASLIDGARLSGATMRIFPHNNIPKLSDLLQWADGKRTGNGRILVMTEAVFSMDGDRAPLNDLVALKSQYGALLMVDEAHSFGIMGSAGRGLATLEGVDDQVDVQMGTFSKAAGLAGGYICASREMVDLLINRARSFIYSTAPPPALAATIGDSLRIISDSLGDQLRKKLWENIRLLDPSAESAIVPSVIGENEAALTASTRLLESGFLIPAIRFPTVPRGTARLRMTLSAGHHQGDIIELKKALATDKDSV